MRTIIEVSTVPVVRKSPTSPLRCPSWKIQTRTPRVAPRPAMLSTIAFSGRTTLPVKRNSTTSVVTAIQVSTIGSRLMMPDWVSVYSAAAPPTTTPLAGAGRARTAVTRSWAAGDRGSTSATTDSRCCPSAAVKPCGCGFGATSRPPATTDGGRGDPDDALDPRQPLRVGGDGGGADPGGQDDVERGALAAGELLAQYLGGDRGGVARGQRPVVALAERRTERRRGQREEQPADDDENRHGDAHGPAGDARPRRPCPSG